MLVLGKEMLNDHEVNILSSTVLVSCNSKRSDALVFDFEDSNIKCAATKVKYDLISGSLEVEFF